MKQGRSDDPRKPRKDSLGYVSSYREKLIKGAKNGDPYASEKVSDIRRAVIKNKMDKIIGSPEYEKFYGIKTGKMPAVDPTKKRKM